MAGHFIADVTVGIERKSPYRVGYRPQFHLLDDDCGHVMTFIDLDPAEVWPGESCVAVIELMMWPDLAASVKAGTSFEIREGFRVTVTGVVTRLIDNAGV